MNNDMAIARQALNHINPADRETWFRMGAALKSAFGEDGFDLWDGWSQDASSYKKQDAQAVWKSISEGGGINFGSLIHEAKQNGYQQSGLVTPLSADELEKRRLERSERERLAQAETERKHIAAQMVAKSTINSMPRAVTHKYLTTKGVRGYKIYRLKNGDLAIPMRDVDSVLWSVQTITPDGKKLFLKDGRAKGLFHQIGSFSGKIVIAEGYATGASIHEATGYGVAVAFSAGNLDDVAVALHSKFPTLEIIVAGDLGNGSECAIKAANAVNGRAVFPTVENGKDFNDLHKEQGLEAVSRQIEAVTLETTQPKPNEAVAATPPSVNPIDDSAPEPLPSLPEVMPFNYETLPTVLRDFVKDISERMQCPPDFAAVSSIIMVSAAIGRRVTIRPKKEDNWTVVPNLWGMVVGRSGLMKSPALDATLSPLRLKEVEALENYRVELDSYEGESMLHKLALSSAEQKAKGLISKGDLAGAQLEIDNARRNSVEPPTAPRYISNDSTVEALSEILEENPNGILVDRDELAGWLKSLDKEGQQSSRGFYLSAADGNKGFTTDRIGRGKNRHIKAVTVSIIGGIQPGVLASYVRDTQRGGTGDDGLLQRFGLMVYPDVGKWEFIDRKPSDKAMAAVTGLVNRLCAIEPQSIGVMDGDAAPPFLRFSSDAQEMFNNWLAEHEGKIRSDDEHPAIASHLAKYRKLVPALALINHLCENGIGPVSDVALARSLLMAEYLESHARRVYSYASRPDVDAARSLIGKIKSGKLKAPFKAQEVYRCGWSGLTTSEEAWAALNLLRDHGYLYQIDDERESDKGGRKPKPMFDAHPSIKGTP